MKKNLLKPPPHNGNILFLPSIRELNDNISEKTKIGVCHQPYFFNPGVSLKFIFLENLSKGNKEIIFLDTDRIIIKVKVPLCGGKINEIRFLESDQVLSHYPAPEKSFMKGFFSALENELKTPFS